ncbi:MAG: hypothetical protein WAV11_00500 [Minisyncoccia bacterium]
MVKFVMGKVKKSATEEDPAGTIKVLRIFREISQGFKKAGVTFLNESIYIQEEKNGRFSIHSAVNGKLINEKHYQKVNILNLPNDDKFFIRVMENGRWGLLTKTGKTVLPCNNVSIGTRQGRKIYFTTSKKEEMILDPWDRIIKISPNMKIDLKAYNFFYHS